MFFFKINLIQFNTYYKVYLYHLKAHILSPYSITNFITFNMFVLLHSFKMYFLLYFYLNIHLVVYKYIN